MKAEWTNSDLLTTSQITKAILVIDMPTHCGECPVKCRMRGINHVPSWCPLKPLPQKKEPFYDINEGDYDKRIDGWNNCLDEILGETE